MAEFAPDFESYFAQEKMSDVVLVLREEESRKRKRDSDDEDLSSETDHTTLPGHSMVLLAYSGFCKTKLENWSEASTAASSNSTAKHSIEISVPAGQLELGQRLVKCIYQKEPAVTDLESVQLLQILLLADRYEVPKVQVAVLDALLAVPAVEWSWQTLLDVLDLPVGCANHARSKAVIAAAVERLQQQLGDLEAIWADEQLQQQLLSLPFSALLQLLQDDKTRVASEHTVVYTIIQWYQQQPESTRSIAQLKQLMQQVRMQHCSQLYIVTFMMQNKLVLKCFTVQELAKASLCVSSTTVLKDGKCPLLQQYPAWTAAKRPTSNKPQLLQWQLPLEQLKTAVEGNLDDGDTTDIFGEPTVLQGQAMQMVCDISRADEGTSNSNLRKLNLGLFLKITDSPGVYRNIRCTLKAIAASSASDNITGLRYRCFSDGKFWGCPEFLGLPGTTSWAYVEAVLRQKNLVHPDRCLHLEIEVHDMQ